MAEKLTLIIFSIFAFLIISIFAFHTRKSNKWNHIDLFYYPLAALGIVLFFIAKSQEIKITFINNEYSKRIAEYEEINNSKPNIDITDRNLLLTATSGFIKIISDSYKTCKSPYAPYDAYCQASLKTFPYIENLSTINLSSKNYSENLHKYCKVYNSSISEISNSNEFNETLKTKLISSVYSIEKERSIYSEENFLEKKLESEALKEYKELLSTPYFDDIRDYSTRKFEAEIGFAKLIFRSGLLCSQSDMENLNRFDEWEKSKTNKENEVINLKTYLEREEKNKKIDFFKEVELYLWNYIAIIALSLKFGKGISSSFKNKENIKLSFKLINNSYITIKGILKNIYQKTKQTLKSKS